MSDQETAKLTQQVQKINEKLVRIEVMLESQSKAKEKTYQNEKEIIKLKNDIVENTEDIKEIKGNNKWLFRTVAGAIIVEVLGILFMLFGRVPL